MFIHQVCTWGCGAHQWVVDSGLGGGISSTWSRVSHIFQLGVGRGHNTMRDVDGMVCEAGPVLSSEAVIRWLFFLCTWNSGTGGRQALNSRVWIRTSLMKTKIMLSADNVRGWLVMVAICDC